MIQASGKLVLVDKLLPKLKAGGHRVLIFSQMIRVLDILEDYLIQTRQTYERIDGRIRGDLRQEAIERYSKPDSDRFVFLLCTRAGGLGINLTAADTVIIYDSDWNPQNDLQAQARVHRIGQKKNVKIYRLITRNTYEREMFDKASLKLGLDKAVLQSMRNDERLNINHQLSKAEIEELLKKGAYGAIMEDDQAADKFCEEDIDKILQQRATVITIDGGEKGSTFSKASFQTSETADISIDDPEFWQKWAKKAEIDIEEKLNPKDERIIYEPRRRTQTRRYGGPDDMLEESDYSSSGSDNEKPTDPNDPKANNPDRKKGKKKRGKNANGQKDDQDSNFKLYENENDDENDSVWSRDDCYRVEKNLLIYGWSRWGKILENCQTTNKKKSALLTEQDVESCARTIIAFTCKNYQGEESIKQFIQDLIDPQKSNFDDLKSHQGLAAPIPRGRRKQQENQENGGSSNNPNDQNENPNNDMEWAKNAGDLIGDENYKKHLNKQANKILLRLRTLFYIKHEIVGDEYSQKLDQAEEELIPSHEEIDLQLPECGGSDLPAEWWDTKCDQSLLLGVYKHGYEKYYQMRIDSKLCFLQLCGQPDAYEQQAEEEEQKKLQQQDENDETETAAAAADTTEKPVKSEENADEIMKDENVKHFPGHHELNNRLRRLIAIVQKCKKQSQLMSKREQEKNEKRLSKLASIQEKASQRQIERQAKWSRREEQNFYKAIFTFGYDQIDQNSYAWDRFREIGQLEKKLDETLVDYLHSFLYMCKRVCNKLDESTQAPQIDAQCEQISEDRASRCLQRVEIFNKVRQNVLKHEKFNEWLNEYDDELKITPGSDMPDWYVPGKHDRDLLKAIARYGLARTEMYYLNDDDLQFKDYLTKFMRHIEYMMDDENKNFGEDDADSRLNDPVQFYFQNQAKIQMTFRQNVIEKEIRKQQKNKEKTKKTKKIVKKIVIVKKKEASEQIKQETVEETPTVERKEENEQQNEEKSNEEMEVVSAKNETKIEENEVKKEQDQQNTEITSEKTSTEKKETEKDEKSLDEKEENNHNEEKKGIYKIIFS